MRNRFQRVGESKAGEGFAPVCVFRRRISNRAAVSRRIGKSHNLTTGLALALRLWPPLSWQALAGATSLSECPFQQLSVRGERTGEGRVEMATDTNEAND